MSGYFAPVPSQVPAGNKPGGKPTQVDVFAGDPALKLINTPQEYLARVPTSELPAFWLAAGAADRSDVDAAAYFRHLLLARLAKVPLLIVPGGHQGSVWRAALGPMLTWMTPQLAEQAAAADAAATRGAPRSHGRTAPRPRANSYRREAVMRATP